MDLFYRPRFYDHRDCRTDPPECFDRPIYVWARRQKVTKDTGPFQKLEMPSSPFEPEFSRLLMNVSRIFVESADHSAEGAVVYGNHKNERSVRRQPAVNERGDAFEVGNVLDHIERDNGVERTGERNGAGAGHGEADGG